MDGSGAVPSIQRYTDQSKGNVSSGRPCATGSGIVTGRCGASLRNLYWSFVTSAPARGVTGNRNQQFGAVPGRCEIQAGPVREPALEQTPQARVVEVDRVVVQGRHDTGPEHGAGRRRIPCRRR